MSNHVLDKAYQISSAGGVESGRVVVRGATPGECLLPAAANAGSVLGVTMHAQARAGRFVAVRRLGIAQAVAAGAIPAGSRVCIADNQGRIAALPSPRFETGNGGSDNALNLEWIADGLFTPGLVIEIVNPGDTAPFSWSFASGRVRIVLPHNGEELLMTAAGLKAAIEADATLSRLFRASIRSGPGAGLVLDGTVSVANAASLLNSIGIAEQPAAQAGNLVDVFLVP